jgi:hypothetical protein
VFGGQTLELLVIEEVALAPDPEPKRDFAFGLDALPPPRNTISFWVSLA